MKYIDLGLPSGTLWADRNIGALSSYDYGDYFTFNKARELGVLPSKEQFEELIVKCKCTIKTFENINGMLFERNENSIFMPFSGICNPGERSAMYVNNCGNWWSYTQETTYFSYYFYIDFNNRQTAYCMTTYRFSVRLVKNILWK